jgi:hypothetical protein
MSYHHKARSVICSKCLRRAGWFRDTKDAAFPDRWRCGECGILHHLAPPAKWPPVPEVLYAGTGKFARFKLHPVPPGCEDAAWAQPYSVRSVVYPDRLLVVRRSANPYLMTSAMIRNATELDSGRRTELSSTSWGQRLAIGLELVRCAFQAELWRFADLYLVAHNPGLNAQWFWTLGCLIRMMVVGMAVSAQFSGCGSGAVGGKLKQNGKRWNLVRKESSPPGLQAVSPHRFDVF